MRGQTSGSWAASKPDGWNSGEASNAENKKPRDWRQSGGKRKKRGNDTVSDRARIGTGANGAGAGRDRELCNIGRSIGVNECGIRVGQDQIPGGKETRVQPAKMKRGVGKGFVERRNRNRQTPTKDDLRGALLLGC